MNQRFKKIIIIHLLALTILPVLFSFYFTIHQGIIHQQMEERLENTFLQIIQIKKAELVWVKQGKEIRVGNHMFDIKSIKEKNGVCEIKGLYDTDEDLLHEKLNKTQRNTEQQSQQVFLNFFFQLYTSFSTGFTEVFTNEIVTGFSNHFSIQLPSPTVELLSPPPNV
jgi:hypothetical protein